MNFREVEDPDKIREQKKIHKKVDALRRKTAQLQTECVNSDRLAVAATLADITRQLDACCRNITAD